MEVKKRENYKKFVKNMKRKGSNAQIMFKREHGGVSSRKIASNITSRSLQKHISLPEI